MKSSLFQVLLAIFLSCTLHAQKAVEDEKLEYYRSVMGQGLRDDNPKQIAKGYYLLGKYEEKMNNFTEAYRLLIYALTISENIKDYKKTTKVYQKLSILELKQKNFEKAKQYAQEAIRQSSLYNLPKRLRSSYSHMGNIYLEYSRWTDSTFSSAASDSALYFFSKVESLATSEKNDYELAKSRHKSGLIYLQKGDKKAIENLMYAAQISKSKTQNELIEYHTDLARAWMELGFYSDAEKVLSECQSLIDRNVNVKPLYESYFYFTYALYNETTGELPRAIELNAKAFSKLSELSVNERKAHFPVDLEAMLKTQKGGLLLKASSIETEVKQSIISKQQLFLTFIITSFFLLAAFSYCLYRNYLKQKLLSQKKEFLIREHHHRVKNNLQAISSMLSLHHYHLTDDVSKAILAESQTRIDSMMLLHRQLYENDSTELVDIETFFQQIIHSVALTFGVYDFHAKVDLEEQFLETDIATSIGVILNELAINSFKHAFPNTPHPLIEVSSKGSGGVIKIRYKDSGKKDIGSLFNNPEKRGFGLSLIGMILYQIDGKMNYHFENGSVFTISFKS